MRLATVKANVIDVLQRLYNKHSIIQFNTYRKELKKKNRTQTLEKSPSYFLSKYHFTLYFSILDD
jgi:hypothetical protein